MHHGGCSGSAGVLEQLPVCCADTFNDLMATAKADVPIICVASRAGRGASDVAFRAGSIEQQMTRMLAAASQPVLTEVHQRPVMSAAFRAYSLLKQRTLASQLLSAGQPFDVLVAVSLHFCRRWCLLTLITGF